MMAAALSAWHAGLDQVVVTGDRHEPATAALADELARRYLPFTIALPVPVDAEEAATRLLRFVAPMTARRQAAAWVCRNFTCEAPVFNAASLAATLDRRIGNR
jgi:uncharacterized protein YyaL (SSP411 family)